MNQLEVKINEIAIPFSSQWKILEWLGSQIKMHRIHCQIRLKSNQENSHLKFADDLTLCDLYI